jgi:hypothetical protein
VDRLADRPDRLRVMGRLGLKERRFLAEILLGFILRDYRRVAEVHFEEQRQDLRHRDLVGPALVDRLADRPDRLREIVDGVVRSISASWAGSG